jgi:hypothetical protein
VTRPTRGRRPDRPALPDDEVEVRVGGSPEAVRGLVEAIGQLAEVLDQRGPYERRSGGAHYYLRVRHRP